LPAVFPACLVNKRHNVIMCPFL